ncbi:hypothetical protein [Desulfofustis limnaeus]|jgi:hypothetical protein|uniref:Uncharacterized protein n=1 Tax=Desulfofustis limnaeus TaxID=2740163 RepID=A0ABN6M3Q8_9BACT|nr:hypothetical protein [Desulfofustis limnaeus]MDX9896479.1 hypothetical protein [Desulfofustis sp.]BDD87547.1 hypothetical protein DPPLL_19120 [Desulfofustis limnaeus]
MNNTDQDHTPAGQDPSKATTNPPSRHAQKPSADELERMVAVHLGRERSRTRVSPWVLRVLSALIAVIVLLLLFSWLPE